MKLVYSLIITMLPLMAFSQEEASFYFEFNNKDIVEVFAEVEEKFDVRFSYKDSDLKDKQFSLQRSKLTLLELLDQLTLELGLQFNVLENRYIIVLKKADNTFATQQLEDIVVYGYLAKGISKAKDASFTILPNELEILPGLTEPDILESLQQLPGVSSPNETATGLVVRGGVSDQNRLIWDDINMYHKGHLFGMISPFNPNAAKQVTFINKGTNPRFGERVSSVIDIKTTNEVSNTFTGSAGINGISGDVYLELPIIEDKLSIQTSVRRSYTELYKSFTFAQLADKVFQSTKIEAEEDAEDDFSFLDFNAKINYRHNENNKFAISIITIDNQLDFINRDNDNNQLFNDVLSIKNLGYSAKWDKIWSSKLSQTTSVSFSDYELNYNFITVEDNQQISDFDKRNAIFDSGISTEFHLDTKNSTSYNFGYQFNLKDVSYGFINTTDLSFILDADKTIIRTHSLFANSTFNRDWVQLNFGVRANYFQSLEAFRVEPRLMVYIPITKRLKFQGSGEIKNQIINEIDETVLSDFTLENKLWRLADGSNFPIINSYQLSAGFIYNNNGWRIDIDNYYKRIDNITALSFGYLNPEINTFRTGDRKIFGVDVLVEKNIKRFKTWLSYSYTQMENRYDGINDNQYFTSSTNIRHVINASLTYNYKKLQFALGWRFQSGKPFTESITNSNDEIELVGVNSGQLEVYHRLDFSSTYQFNFSKASNLKGKVGLSIRNIYDRNNQISREYTGNNSPDDPIRVVDKFALGFTPNVLFRVYW